MTRTTCTIIVLIVLFIPLAKRYGVIPGADYKLNGAAEAATKPTFSFHGFSDGDFQEKTTAYLQDNVGYKGFLIALKNQIDYSLFNNLHYGVELGENGQLYSWEHVVNHCGQLTISDDSLHSKIRECVDLKRILDSMHIASVFVLAPAKPNFYEDKLPAKYKGQSSANNDYHHVLSALNANKLPVIDFNAWIKSMRNSSKYPLFPRLGTHWSYYGGGLAMDSLSKYIAAQLDLNLPIYKIDSLKVTDQPGYKNDKDLGSLLNLLVPMKSDSLAYPSYSVNYDPEKHKKPKILFIGDSFVWTLLDTKLPAQLFSAESRYWFYKHQLYQLDSKWITDNPDEVNLQELLKGTDIVIFVSTEFQNHRFDFELLHAIKGDLSITQAKTIN